MKTLVDLYEDEDPEDFFLEAGEDVELDALPQEEVGAFEVMCEIAAPTIRCKRCDSWLRVTKTWADGPNDAPREYCEMCTLHMQTN